MIKKTDINKISKINDLFEKHHSNPEIIKKKFQDRVKFNNNSTFKSDIATLFIEFSVENEFTLWINDLQNSKAKFVTRPLDKLSDTIYEEMSFRRGYSHGFDKCLKLIKEGKSINEISQEQEKIEKWRKSRFISLQNYFTIEPEINEITVALNNYLDE